MKPNFQVQRNKHVAWRSPPIKHATLTETLTSLSNTTSALVPTQPSSSKPTRVSRNLNLTTWIRQSFSNSCAKASVAARARCSTCDGNGRFTQQELNYWLMIERRHSDNRLTNNGWAAVDFSKPGSAHLVTTSKPPGRPVTYYLGRLLTYGDCSRTLKRFRFSRDHRTKTNFCVTNVAVNERRRNQTFLTNKPQ